VRAPPTRTAFRPDIEGLRAVAILAVVAYHAHVGVLGGGYIGVDVFYVISGFLITDLLWAELEATGRLSFAGFYARRARRLLPAAMVVLVVTVAASALALPPLQMASVWKDGLAAALYVGNYRFALEQANYLSASAPPSPVQQYWSLGVEEQFYLLWPLILLGLALLARRRLQGGQRGAHAAAESGRALALGALGLLAAASFGFCVWLTRLDKPWAFFSLPSRAWELAVGGLLALGATYLRRAPSPVGAAVGWSGLVAVGWAALRFGSATAFPGPAALVPVLGSALVIAGGQAWTPWGPVALLGLAPLRFVGRISYSWYLWHWPVLLLAPYAIGTNLGLPAYLGLAAGSGALATATYYLVEKPARRSRFLAGRPRRSLLAGATLSAAGAACCFGVAATLPPLVGRGLAPVASLAESPLLPKSPSSPAAAGADQAGKRAQAGASEGSLGRSFAEKGPSPREVALAHLRADQAAVEAAVARSAALKVVPANLNPPLPDASASEAAPFFDGCLQGFTGTAVLPCTFGDTSAHRTVVLFGDSHATMWFPALDAIANSRHWRLVVWTKATCPPVEVSLFSPDLGREYSECDYWRSEAMARIAALRPMAVVLGIAPNYDAPYGVPEDGPAWLAGLSRAVRAIEATGAKAVLVGPVPSPGSVVPDCLSAHLYDVPVCDVTPRDTHEGPGLVGYDKRGDAAAARAVERAGGSFVDVEPWFCTSATCPVIVGNLLVFRDNSHLTVPYATYLAPVLSDELSLALYPR
jgi:peptidoglycan/LPS O-acetylase OafA/YrhL